MPPINIYWKGCPRLYLPRIRTASQHSRAHGSSQSAAEAVVLLPFGPDLERARNQQRKRRRKHLSISSLGSPHDSIIIWRDSRLSETAFRRKFAGPYKRSVRRRHSAKRRLASSNCRLTSGLPSGKSDCPRLSKPSKNNQGVDFALKAPSNFRYWGSIPCISAISLPQGPEQENIHRRRRVGGEYSKSHSTLALSQRDGNRTQPPTPRVRTYDPRLPIRIFHYPIAKTTGAVSLDVPSQSSVDPHSPRIKYPRQTTHSLPSSSVIMYQSDELESSTDVSLPSRTPSEREGLALFTQELEQHLKDEKPMVIEPCHFKSPTMTSFGSANTVSDFLPFQAEFNAVGLAVTSKQQREKMVSPQKEAPPRPVEIEQCILDDMSDASPTEFKDPGSMSPGFFTSIASPPTTVVTFRSPELLNPRQPLPIRTPKVNARKYLPWLRSADPLPDTPAKPQVLEEPPFAASPSTATTCTSATTIIDFSPHPSDFWAKQEGEGIYHFAISDLFADLHADFYAFQRRHPGLNWQETDRPEHNSPLESTEVRPVLTDGYIVAARRGVMFAVTGPSLAESSPTKRSSAKVNDETTVSGNIPHKDISQEPQPIGASCSHATTIDTNASYRALFLAPTDEDSTLIPDKSPSRPTNKVVPYDEQRLKIMSPLEIGHSIEGASRQFSAPFVQHKPESSIDTGKSMRTGLDSQMAEVRTVEDDDETEVEDSAPTLRPLSPTSRPQSPADCEQCRQGSSIKEATDLEPQMNRSFPQWQAGIPFQLPSKAAASSATTDANIFQSSTLPCGHGAPFNSNYEPAEGDSVKGDTIKRVQARRKAARSHDAAAPSIFTILESRSERSASAEAAPQRRDISDRDVLKGLEIAISAACDEDMDSLIKDISGKGVRRFLADLASFDGLGLNTLADVARRKAVTRKKELKKLAEEYKKVEDSG
jgi:hypothetical protein